MSTKPTVLPRWSVTADGATVSNVNTPPSGKLDVGWAPSEQAPAQWFNFLHYYNYLWCQYLSDGAFSGASTFDSTLGVTGLITANAGVTLAANQDVILSGTGKVRHGTRETVIPAAGWRTYQGAPTLSSTGQWTFSTPPNDRVVAPILLPVGARILSVGVMADNGGSASGFTVYLWKRSTGTASTIATGSGGGSGTGIAFWNAIASANYTLVSHEEVWIEFAVGDTVHKLNSAIVTWDTP